MFTKVSSLYFAKLSQVFFVTKIYCNCWNNLHCKIFAQWANGNYSVPRMRPSTSALRLSEVLNSYVNHNLPIGYVSEQCYSSGVVATNRGDLMAFVLFASIVSYYPPTLPLHALDTMLINIRNRILKSACVRHYTLPIQFSY